MTREELLNGRGFRDEKHLNEFLDNCKDETWKQELIEYFGTDTKTKKSEEKVEEVKETKTTSKTKKNEEEL